MLKQIPAVHLSSTLGLISIAIVVPGRGSPPTFTACGSFSPLPLVGRHRLSRSPVAIASPGRCSSSSLGSSSSFLPLSRLSNLLLLREASDDEDGDRSDGELPGSRVIRSDSESDGQGAAQVYDDEDEFDEEEFEAEEEEEEGTGERGGRERGGGGAPREAEVATPAPPPLPPAEAAGTAWGSSGSWPLMMERIRWRRR